MESEEVKSKAKALINWSELSRILVNNRSSITRDRVSDVHKEKIETLINLVTDWIVSLPVK